MNIHEKPVTEQDRIQVLTLIRDQAYELMATHEIHLTCGACKTKAPLRHMYHCFFCGVWFCKRCAAVHFGPSSSTGSGS